MCVTAILTETERKRQDGSVHRTEERRRRAGMMRVCGPTCPHSSVLAHARTAQGPKRLISKRNQATLASKGMPLGECRFLTFLINTLPAKDSPAFAAYVREVLVPEIVPGTAVILDNRATQRNKEAAEALREHGCWFLYLTPYSPDLKPIEQAFSNSKAPAPHWLEDLHRRIRCCRHNLRSLRPARILELFQGCWACLKLIPKCYRTDGGQCTG